ncbi:MAG: hypothetical protein ABR591_09195 [Candidatus Velthaea sp.]
MIVPDAPPTRDRTAIALSIAVHLCVLTLAAATVRPAFQQMAEPVEDAHFFTIRVVAHHEAPPPRPHPAPAAAPIPVTRVIKVAVREPQPHRDKVAPAQRRKAAAVRKGIDAIARPVLEHAADARAAEPRPVVVPAVVAAVHDAAPKAVATAAAAPAPTTAPTPFAFGDPGLFGQNYHPLPNPPNAIDTIAARIAAHFHIRVLVDENGRATDVKFLPPMPDAATVDELRSKLLAMTYVPADCNGLRCSGDLDLKY